MLSVITYQFCKAVSLAALEYWSNITLYLYRKGGYRIFLERKLLQVELCRKWSDFEMDKLRSRTRENNRIKNISLPTLFEYGDARKIDDWSTDRKIWLDMMKVSETKKSPVSALPDLMTKLPKMKMMASEKNDIDLENISEHRPMGENRPVADEDDEFTDYHNENEGKANQENEKVRFKNNEREIGGKPELDNLPISQKRCSDMKRAASESKCEDDKSERFEKMDSVRRWVKDQSIVKWASKTDALDGSGYDKLPEMPCNKSRNNGFRIRSISEGSWSTRGNVDGTREITFAKNHQPRMVEATSELSSRLLDTRHRKKNAVLSSEPLSVGTCDKESMNDNIGETVSIPLIGRPQNSARRTCTPFPMDESPRKHTQKQEKSTARNGPVRAIVPTSRMTSSDIPLRSSSAFSWPVSSHGIRCVATSEGRRRPSTPRPPALLSRSSSNDL